MMAVVMTATISDDLWTLPEDERVDVTQLQVKDFTKWVRKQVREGGRKAQICDQRYSAVEIWLQELGVQAGFTSGGDIQIGNEWYVTDWMAISYYMQDEDGMMETKAGKWLDICKLEDQEAYLIRR